MTVQLISTFFLLALAIACIAWTVTHEEVFREPREFCKARCTPDCKPIVRRKFFYLFTCEYCFSHYVTAAVILLTGFKLPLSGRWVDYVLTGFALVFVANIYMSLYFKLKLEIKRSGALAKIAVSQVPQPPAPEPAESLYYPGTLFPKLDKVTNKRLPLPTFTNGYLNFIDYIKQIRLLNIDSGGVYPLKEAKEVADRIFPAGMRTRQMANVFPERAE